MKKIYAIFRLENPENLQTMYNTFGYRWFTDFIQNFWSFTKMIPEKYMSCFLANSGLIALISGRKEFSAKSNWQPFKIFLSTSTFIPCTKNQKNLSDRVWEKKAEVPFLGPIWPISKEQEFYSKTELGLFFIITHYFLYY